jgi:hypothetical protein
VAETGGSGAPGHPEPASDGRRKWHATFRTRFATLGVFISRKRNGPKPDPLARYTSRLGWFTLLLAIVTALQLFTFITSERAFLTVAEVSPHQPPLVVGKPLNLILEIGNGGKSTGSVDLLNLSYSIQELPDEPNYGTGSQLFSSPILPGTHHAFGMGTEKLVPTQQLFDSVVNGTIKFYLYGFIRYSDDFSWFGYRVTGFCFLYAPDGDPKSVRWATCNKRKYVYSSGTWGWPSD